MRPIHEIDRYLEDTMPELRDIVLELRNLIAAAAPEATEVIHRRYLSYFYGDRGGPVSAGICQIGLYHDHLRLAFIHGAFLPDPNGLLTGPEKYKRFVELYSYEQAPWDDLRDLITASARFDPYTLNMRKD